MRNTAWLTLLMLGCGEWPVPTTEQEFLSQWLPIACERSAECLEQEVDYEQCMRAGEEMYCNRDTCVDTEMGVGRAGWNRCLDAYATMPCEEVRLGWLPRECENVDAFGL